MYLKNHYYILFQITRTKYENKCVNFNSVNIQVVNKIINPDKIKLIIENEKGKFIINKYNNNLENGLHFFEYIGIDKYIVAVGIENYIRKNKYNFKYFRHNMNKDKLYQLIEINGIK